jgi:four helix bundle protein
MMNTHTMNDNPAQEKSYAFALRIVKLYRWFVEEKKEFTLCKQLLRAGTSIGANVEEAIGGQSGKDFLSKMAIAYKETRESQYWLRLLHDSQYLSDPQFNSLIADCEELLRIIGSICKTTKQKLGIKNYE